MYSGSTIAKDTIENLARKEVSAAEAEFYSDVSKAPRLSSSLPLNLYIPASRSPPFAVQAVIAQINENDSSIPLEEDRNTEHRPLVVIHYTFVRKPSLLRQFLRVRLSQSTLSLQGLVIDASYRFEAYPSPLDSEHLTIPPQNVIIKSDKSAHAMQIDRVHVPPIAAGKAVIVDCPGFTTKCGSATRRSGSFQETIKFRPPNITGIALKIIGADGVTLFQGCWPANLDLKASMSTVERANALRFRITKRKYRISDDILGAVRAEFGVDYDVADWQDLVRYPGDIRVLLDAVGLTEYCSKAIIGFHTSSTSWTHRFIERHDSRIPPGWKAIDTIQDHLLDMGSSSNSQMPILCKKKTYR